ncbi:MAG: hypothetical protein K8I04_02285 [Gammaproteobacteria bacterium]|nr:hypothetical protein [Gammaproteobacteria bacterium]
MPIRILCIRQLGVLAIAILTLDTAVAFDLGNGFRLGGALRYNYVYQDWDPRYDGAGLINFDTFRIDTGYDHGDWLASAQYRFYRYRGGTETNFLQHAWVGRRFGDRTQLQLGVNSIPFGILPYASHSFFFSIAYYVGLEDSYNLGGKLMHTIGPWDLQLGYYVRDGGHGSGNSESSARYTFNLVEDGAIRNHERDTLVGRAAYTFEQGAARRGEVGLSLLAGRLPNATTGRDGHRRAAAVHYQDSYGPWGVMLQAARYVNSVENPPGQDRRIVIMGAYDFPYEVAARANVYTVNLSYTLGTWGPLHDVTLYADYGWLSKDVAGFRDSAQRVFGMSFTPIDKVFVYVDYLRGRQHPYIGPNFTTGLAAGGSDDTWHERLNINVGLYF